MNKDNIKHIFSAYINKFEYINNLSNDENYKWRIATEFRELMDETLRQTTKDDFVNALKKVKKCSHNLIDNYIQPFEGLIQVADKNDEAANQVKSIFIDLYADDEGDLNKQELIIEQFLIKANELVNNYFPDSFRYINRIITLFLLIFFFMHLKRIIYLRLQKSRYFLIALNFMNIGVLVQILTFQYFIKCAIGLWIK